MILDKRDIDNESEIETESYKLEQWVMKCEVNGFNPYKTNGLLQVALFFTNKSICIKSLSLPVLFLSPHVRIRS